MKKYGTAWIGTSNIIVPVKKENYPPGFRDKSRLHFYSSIFNSLEVNSSFYKVPKPSTFAKWAGEVAGDFRFSVKLYKEITHVKDLKYDPVLVDQFMDAIINLGTSAGCLLVQFPGKISFDFFSAVEAILSSIRASDPTLRIAVEFRNPSWYAGETFELLDEYEASLVIHDIARSKNETVNKRAGFIYIRFHGPTGNYRGSYEDDILMDYGCRINSWLQQGKDVYAYFNNSMGNAFNNAIFLMGEIKNNGPRKI